MGNYLEFLGQRSKNSRGILEKFSSRDSLGHICSNCCSFGTYTYLNQSWYVQKHCFKTRFTPNVQGSLYLYIIICGFGSSRMDSISDLKKTIKFSRQIVKNSDMSLRISIEFKEATKNFENFGRIPEILGIITLNFMSYI